jgi:plasmid stabilization system protein ParE
MGYEVRLTAKARGDLNEIVAYIAQDNALAAEKLGDELAAEADTTGRLRRHFRRSSPMTSISIAPRSILRTECLTFC